MSLAAKTTKTKASDIAVALRARVLQLKPQDIGLHDPAECPVVWGIVIDTAYPDTVASLVALDDGSVSLYVSDGNGCVGCGSQQEVRWAAADLLQLAERALPLTAPTADLSMPRAGQVRCYLLTPNGLHLVEAPYDDIAKIDERLGVLYFAGQRVIAAIERVGAGQSLAQEIRLALNAMNPNPGVEDQPRHCAQGDEQCLSVGNVVRRLRT
jgi:hypothetical protein